MTQKIKNNIYPIGLTLIYLIIGFIMYPAGVEVGDPGIKHLQVLDLVSQDLKSLTCNYSGAIFDKEMEFLPLKNSFFLHIINHKCYYVFPFYFTILITPLHLIFGTSGEYMIPLYSGIFLLWIVWAWAGELKFSERLRKFLLVYLGIASGILHYISTLSEMNLNALLVTSAFYLTWKSIEFNRNKYFYLASMILGISVFFRQESIAIAGILVFFLFILKQKKIRILIPFLLIYSFFISIWLAINYGLFNNIFGLRGYQQVQEISEGSFLKNRLMMVVEVFFYGRYNVGLLFATPILFLIFVKAKDVLNYNKAFISIFLTAVSFALFVPIATITYQGIGWGTRFLLSITPVLFISVFTILESDIANNQLSKLYKWYKISFIWSAIGILSLLGVCQFILKETNRLNSFVKKSTGDTIILITDNLESSVISSYGAKIFIAKDKEKFLRLISILSEKKIKEVSIVYNSEFFFKESEFFTEEINEKFESEEKKELKEIRIKNVKLK